jgi:hypothetical protein
LPQIRSDASQPHQRLAHSLIANPAAGPRSATPVHLSSPQQTHRVLAVIAGLQRPSGASSQWTRRWRGMDSNLRYRAATGAGFAADSTLEEAGFELSVPPERKAALDRVRGPSVTRRQASLIGRPEAGT